MHLLAHDHPWSVRMPSAFDRDFLKNVAVHKEQRNRHTDSTLYM